jgi:hypothetical protein
VVNLFDYDHKLFVIMTMCRYRNISFSIEAGSFARLQSFKAANFAGLQPAFRSVAAAACLAWLESQSPHSLFSL